MVSRRRSMLSYGCVWLVAVVVVPHASGLINRYCGSGSSRRSPDIRHRRPQVVSELHADTIAVDADVEDSERIRKMRGSAIQAELKSLGVRYDDCFDKNDLVKRLIETKFPKAAVEVEVEVDSSAKKTPWPKPPPQPTYSKTKRPFWEGRVETPAPEEYILTIDDFRREGFTMRIKALQVELKSMGVSTVGMFEKPELVEAFAQAKLQGPGGRVPYDVFFCDDEYTNFAETQFDDVVYDDADGFDDDVIELVTTKMPKEGAKDRQQESRNDPNMDGGTPFDGGVPGTMPNDVPDRPGMRGGGTPGGLDLGSILQGMMDGGGAKGGAAGQMQRMVQKAMGNPKLIAALQRAATNPKAMAAIQDVLSKGPNAINKYAKDREIKAILDDLRSIL